jgi:predicted  nucleic acid-binding Zn-ribbon protein
MNDQTAEVVNLDKKEVVVNFNLTEALSKAETEFNELANRIRGIDEQIKKANEALQTERNKVYTRAVEVQGTIRFLQAELQRQVPTEDKK